MICPSSRHKQERLVRSSLLGKSLDERGRHFVHVELDRLGNIELHSVTSGANDSSRDLLDVGLLPLTLSQSPLHVQGGHLENLEIALLAEPIERDVRAATLLPLGEKDRQSLEDEFPERKGIRLIRLRLADGGVGLFHQRTQELSAESEVKVLEEILLRGAHSMSASARADAEISHYLRRRLDITCEQLVCIWVIDDADVAPLSQIVFHDVVVVVLVATAKRCKQRFRLVLLDRNSFACEQKVGLVHLTLDIARQAAVAGGDDPQLSEIPTGTSVSETLIGAEDITHVSVVCAKLRNCRGLLTIRFVNCSVDGCLLTPQASRNAFAERPIST